MAGETVGDGLKRTPAYNTPLTEEQLRTWIHEFWGKTPAAVLILTDTRTQGRPDIWQLLRNCCDEDPATAEALLVAAGLQIPQGSLTLVIDDSGVYYRVPICCINKPLAHIKNEVQ